MLQNNQENTNLIFTAVQLSIKFRNSQLARFYLKLTKSLSSFCSVGTKSKYGVTECSDFLSKSVPRIPPFLLSNAKCTFCSFIWLSATPFTKKIYAVQLDSSVPFKDQSSHSMQYVPFFFFSLAVASQLTCASVCTVQPQVNTSRVNLGLLMARQSHILLSPERKELDSPQLTDLGSRIC